MPDFADSQFGPIFLNALLNIRVRTHGRDSLGIDIKVALGVL